jgi:quinol monooxygenase YgiN
VGDEPVQALLAGRRALLVRLTCEPGRRPALLDMLNTYADGLSEEPGTELFVVSLDPDDETIVWLYEMFKDEDAETAHRSSAGFAAMMHQMPTLIGSPPAILRMDPLRMAFQEAVLAEDWTL